MSPSGFGYTNAGEAGLPPMPKVQNTVPSATIPITAILRDRMQGEVERLCALADRLENLTDDLLGPIPKPAAEANVKIPPLLGGALGMISELILAIDCQVERIHKATERLREAV